MKKILFIVSLALIAEFAFGQNTPQPGRSPLPVGKSQINVGVGLSDWGVPLYIGFDVCALKDLTLGGEFSFRSYREYWKHETYYRHTISGFSVNGNYHFNSVLNIQPKWDFYAGLNIGFFYWTSPDNYYGDHTSGLGLGAQVGGRYYLSDKVGLNLEFGGGNEFYGGKFGLSFKL